MRTPILPAGRRRNQQGIALVIAIFALAAFMLAAAAGLLVGSSNAKATRNYRGATQVHFVAESAVSEALQIMNGPGVVHFQNDVVNSWGATWGTAPKGFPALSGYGYAAAVTAGADPQNQGWLTATGTGPEGAANTVIAVLLRSNVPSTAPGALYLAADAPTNANFNGNAWAVDGNDHNYTGGMGPGAPVPGLSTRTDTNTQEAISSLNGSQVDNIQGQGYSAGPPIVPSVMTSPAAPTSAQLNQMILDILAISGALPQPSNQVVGHQIFGTPAAPQVTYFAGDTTIKASGTADGAGILIIDGDLTIKGDLDFKGLILVRGKTAVTGDTDVTGNATVYGSLWTNDINLVVGGSAIIQYSTQALALANLVVPGNILPSPMRVTALIDCGQVPAGTNGCP
jgi:hypothetical protein